MAAPPRFSGILVPPSYAPRRGPTASGARIAAVAMASASSRARPLGQIWSLCSDVWGFCESGSMAALARGLPEVAAPAILARVGSGGAATIASASSRARRPGEFWLLCSNVRRFCEGGSAAALASGPAPPFFPTLTSNKPQRICFRGGRTLADGTATPRSACRALVEFDIASCGKNWR